MDLKQLRYFVTVAEELSFSKAAARLHMSQPPLSQQIKALEEEMGVDLLFRNRREVRLTHAGTVFLKECRSLLDQFRTAVNTAVHASETHAGTLRIGVATAGLFSVMPVLLDLIRTDFSEVDVLVSDMQSDDQVLAVGQGALDIGIIHARPERMNLGRAAVFQDRLAMVLPHTHPRATQASLRLPDLADEAFVSLSRPHAPTIFDATIAACTRAGFSPAIKHNARSAFTIFQMVAMGFGVALVPASYRSVVYPGVVLRELEEEDATFLKMELIWSERPGSELARKVVEVLTPRLAAALSSGPAPGAQAA